MGSINSTQLPNQMSAIVMDKYGDSSVLRFSTVEVPRPKPDQLLIQNYATSVNPIDWKIRQGDFRLAIRIKFPAILGFDFCGQVMMIGDQCKTFKPGDWVYGRSDQKTGECYAEYVCVSEKIAAPQPSQLKPIEAASIPLAGLTAWQALVHIAKLQSGARILMNGATGGVGLNAVQIAVALGAHVSALASSKNFDLLKNLGVSTCFDYHDYDLRQKTQNLYDIIFDTVGNLITQHALNQMTPKGTFITTLPHLHLIPGWLKGKFKKQKVRFFIMKPCADDLIELNKLISHKHLQPFIQQIFPLHETAAAHRLSEQGHTLGKIVIDVKAV